MSCQIRTELPSRVEGNSLDDERHEHAALALQKCLTELLPERQFSQTFIRNGKMPASQQS
jgi:hypothetical protein